MWETTIQSTEGLNKTKRWRKCQCALSVLAKTFISTDPWTWVPLVLGLLDSDWGLHCYTTCPPLPCKSSALGLRLNYATSFSGSFRLKMADYGTSKLHNHVSQFLIICICTCVYSCISVCVSYEFCFSIGPRLIQ